MNGSLDFSAINDSFGWKIIATNHSNQSKTLNVWKYISDGDRYILVFIVNCFICIPICLLGIGANIINITVFFRQGFSDTINVSLLSLAFSYLGSLLTLLWRNILYIPAIGQSSAPFDPIAMIYLTGGMPHVCFVRISGCITAFIAFERCICIAWPLRVRQICTRSRTIFINVVLFIVSIAAVSPVYYTTRLSWKFFPDRNRTLLGLIYTDDRPKVEEPSFLANGVFLPASAFIVDLACTLIIIFKLHNQARWRRDTASSGGGSGGDKSIPSASKKEVGIIKMVVALSIIFIICSLPINVNFVWMLNDPEFSIEGQFSNTMLVCATFSFLCEAINASLNYFVYMKMSSKFRSTHQQMFCRGEKDGSSETNSHPTVSTAIRF